MLYTRARNTMEASGDQQVLEQVSRLADEYRDRCLWFLHASFVPSNVGDALWVLDLIERYGDRAAFERTTQLRKWLSPRSN